MARAIKRGRVIGEAPGVASFYSKMGLQKTPNTVHLVPKSSIQGGVVFSISAADALRYARSQSPHFPEGVFGSRSSNNPARGHVVVVVHGDEGARIKQRLSELGVRPKIGRFLSDEELLRAALPRGRIQPRVSRIVYD